MIVVIGRRKAIHSHSIMGNLDSTPICADILQEVISEEVSYDEEEENNGVPNTRRPYSNRTSAPRTRNRAYALEEMDALNEKEFTRMFRLNRQKFYWLLEKVTPLIAGHASQDGHRYHTDREISPKTKLACTLRFLAGGSYLDICFAFGVSTSIFYKENGVLWPTMGAIDAVLKIGFPLHDPVWMEETSKGFAAFNGGQMEGCVMAIDGWVCRTRCPTLNEVTNQIAYRNRKGMWGLVVMAGCDHKCRFTMLSVVCPGSTNDSLAWRMTEIYRTVVEPGLLPAQYYIICDEAVSADESVLSPFGGRGLGKWRDSFNYHLSAMRQCIERAFGLLTRRFGIFWRALACDFSRWHLIIRVCAKLHNVCIDSDDQGENIATAAEDHAAGDNYDVVANVFNPENDGEFPANSDQSSNKRMALTVMLKDQGYVRPRHAASNSREL